MMNNKPGPVPDEDMLVETVLEGNDEKIVRLLRERPSYAGLVRDIQSVKNGLESIEDEQSPSFVIENIIKGKNRPFFSRLQDLPLEWYKNPYILSFGFALAAVFFYFIIVFFLK